MAHPIENIMKTTMEQLKEMVDVNTIIGDPIMTGSDTVIVPVSRLCLGFLSGGGEYGLKGGAVQGAEAVARDSSHPFAGTSVAGMNLTPMAFLAINAGVVHVLPANYSCTLDRIIQMVPESLRELDRIIKEACSYKRGSKPEEQANAPTASPAE
ncbi:MAG TPA: GerW family sporulation protein [Clostridia bacterium]|nr:GerW family sporulation protein [Clostridia bacterium]